MTTQHCCDTAAIQHQVTQHHHAAHTLTYHLTHHNPASREARDTLTALAHNLNHWNNALNQWDDTTIAAALATPHDDVPNLDDVARALTTELRGTNLATHTNPAFNIAHGDHEGNTLIYYTTEEDVEHGYADDRYGVVTCETVEDIEHEEEVLNAADITTTLRRLDKAGATITLLEISDNHARELLVDNTEEQGAA